jgi:hypothetical protein
MRITIKKGPDMARPFEKNYHNYQQGMKLSYFVALSHSIKTNQ